MRVSDFCDSDESVCCNWKRLTSLSRKLRYVDDRDLVVVAGLDGDDDTVPGGWILFLFFKLRLEPFNTSMTPLSLAPTTHPVRTNSQSRLNSEALQRDNTRMAYTTPHTHTNVFRWGGATCVCFFFETSRNVIIKKRRFRLPAAPYYHSILYSRGGKRGCCCRCPSSIMYSYFLEINVKMLSSRK